MPTDETHRPPSLTEEVLFLLSEREPVKAATGRPLNLKSSPFMGTIPWKVDSSNRPLALKPSLSFRVYNEVTTSKFAPSFAGKKKNKSNMITQRRIPES